MLKILLMLILLTASTVHDSYGMLLHVTRSLAQRPVISFTQQQRAMARSSSTNKSPLLSINADSLPDEIKKRDDFEVLKYQVHAIGQKGLTVKDFTNASLENDRAKALEDVRAEISVDNDSWQNALAKALEANRAMPLFNKVKAQQFKEKCLKLARAKQPLLVDQTEQVIKDIVIDKELNPAGLRIKVSKDVGSFAAADIKGKFHYILYDILFNKLSLEAKQTIILHELQHLIEGDPVAIDAIYTLFRKKKIKQSSALPFYFHTQEFIADLKPAAQSIENAKKIRDFLDQQVKLLHLAALSPSLRHPSMYNRFMRADSLYAMLVIEKLLAHNRQK